jgi:hypothetical protein
MFSKSNQIALAFPLDLRLHAWTNAVYGKAVAAGFIRPPWHPDDTTILRLHAYFDTGLSPAGAGAGAVWAVVQIVQRARSRQFCWLTQRD